MEVTTNKKEEKSFSVLAPANTFNHFKLQLETELEENLWKAHL